MSFVRASKIAKQLGHLDWCRACRKKVSLTRYSRSEHFRLRTKKSELARRNGSFRHFMRSPFNLAKSRAKKRNLPFTITLEFIEELWEKQRGCCFYSGKTMTRTAGAGHVDTNVSLERVNLELGYVPSNIVLCCMFLNTSKGTKTIEDWLMWAAEVRNYQAMQQVGQDEESDERIA